MKKNFVFAIGLILGLAFLTANAEAQTISQTKQVGKDEITLRVLPAEMFMGQHSAMVWDGGAKAVQVNGPLHPNRHMVVFVERNKMPLEKGVVAIRYRELSSKKATWKTLPVARMHVRKQSLKTTHYGNNLQMKPGKYEVKVLVKGDKPADFSFTLRS